MVSNCVNLGQRDREQPPLARHTLKNMVSTILKLDAGARNETLDGF